MTFPQFFSNKHFLQIGLNSNLVTFKYLYITEVLIKCNVNTTLCFILWLFVEETGLVNFVASGKC